MAKSDNQTEDIPLKWHCFKVYHIFRFYGYDSSKSPNCKDFSIDFELYGNKTMTQVYMVWLFNKRILVLEDRVNDRTEIDVSNLMIFLMFYLNKWIQTQTA